MSFPFLSTSTLYNSFSLFYLDSSQVSLFPINIKFMCICYAFISFRKHLWFTWRYSGLVSFSFVYVEIFFFSNRQLCINISISICFASSSISRKNHLIEYGAVGLILLLIYSFKSFGFEDFYLPYKPRPYQFFFMCLTFHYNCYCVVTVHITFV